MKLSFSVETPSMLCIQKLAVRLHLIVSRSHRYVSMLTKTYRSSVP